VSDLHYAGRVLDDCDFRAEVHLSSAIEEAINRLDKTTVSMKRHRDKRF
jgi:hypothetical protein